MTPSWPREIEVVAALVERRDDSDVLTVHAEACEVCREVVMVTRVMVDERDAARREIRVPAAGQVWWRAAVRARLEAVHAAARPLTWLQGAAGAAACGLLVAVSGIVWPFLRETMMWLVAQAFVASSVGEAALRMAARFSRRSPSSSSPVCVSCWRRSRCTSRCPTIDPRQFRHEFDTSGAISTS